MRWLRRLIRRHTRPVHELDAMKWKMRLSLIYAFCAWNCLGVVAYYMYNGKMDWSEYYGLKLDDEINKRSGVYYAELLGAKTAKIVRVDGFQVTDEVDYIAPVEDTK